MRKNCRTAYTAWNHGKSAKPANSIWSNGTSLYSYSTELVACGRDGQLYLNVTKYSPTTSGHQNALAATLPANTIRVDGVPRGSHIPRPN